MNECPGSTRRPARKTRTRRRLLAAVASALAVAGCATGGSGLGPSGSGTPPASSPTALDADCNPPEPVHTPECDRLRAQAADLDDQIAGLRQSLEGPPRPTGPERAGINARIQDLERQKRALGQRLVACTTRGPARRPEADLNGDLDGTIAITVPGGSALPAGRYGEAVHPAEVRIHFTSNGCRAAVLGLPFDPLRGPVTGSAIHLTRLSGASGEYHPNSGRMRLTFRTTLEVSQGLGGVELTPADASITLAYPGPLSSRRHIRLEGAGRASGGNSGLQTFDVVFDGTLTALPAPQ